MEKPANKSILRPLTGLDQQIKSTAWKNPTVITSQCPIKDWHAIIGEPTVADGILDRLLHHAYKIELKGDSIRKTKK